MEYTWGSINSPWLHENLGCWESLFSDTSIKTVLKNTFLYHTGDNSTHVFFVRKGRFRISLYQEDGDEKQLYIAAEGSICGECSCIAFTCHSTTSMAIVDSEVKCLTSAEFRKRVLSDARLLQRIVEFEVRKNYLFQYQVLSLSFSSASARIARALVDIYQFYGHQSPVGYCLNIHFTKNEIAGLVGTSRVTASSELAKMEQSGILTRYKNHYIITDMAKLLELTSC